MILRYPNRLGHRLQRPGHTRNTKAAYHDYIRTAVPGSGIIRIPFSPKVVGVAESRGNRDHMEDFHAFHTLSLNPEELRLNVKRRHGIDWEPSKLDDLVARQVVYVGIYDGHGGHAVSQYLRQWLHGIVESADKSQVPELFEWLKELGGYFKRFQGGALIKWIRPDSSSAKELLDLEARATLGFFEADRHLSEGGEEAKTCGATASVALLHSIDDPPRPFFASHKLSLTVAHCGDTRILLCARDGGKVLAMTQNHHADAHIEAARLRRMAGRTMDSFGEVRWMGALENTRGLGDLKFKKFGVTAEPEVRTKLLEDGAWSYLVFVSDGVSSVASDQEIVDLVRDAPDPTAGARRILAFAEEMGSDDNLTAMVVPLAGWGRVTGPDLTKEMRTYRQSQAVGSERQKRM